MNWKNDDTFLARWLNGELSEEEKRAFEASEEGQEFVDMMKASALIEPTPYQTDTEFSKLSDRIDSSPRQKVVLWKQKGFQMAVAASLVLLMATIYLFTTGSPTIETGFSEQEIVTLSDGSEVKMNAASVLSYNTKDWDKKRTLNLSGEAFFKVQKGATFVVETANGDVQVLGTSFNVKSRGNVLNVACYTGKVEVRSTNVTKQLLPGDQIRVKNGELIAFKQFDLTEQPSWTGGITELENVNVAEVLEELTFVFGVSIEYDGSLDNIIYTGAFPNQRADKAFELVFKPLNIDYSYDQASNQLTVIGLNQ